MNKDPEGPDKERDESEAEREDRKYDDLLQELRVIQTSAQLTAGFLLTLPFQQRFSDLSTAQERFYLVLVVLAFLVTAAVLGPVATHRQLSGRKVKGQSSRRRTPSCPSRSACWPCSRPGSWCSSST